MTGPARRLEAPNVFGDMIDSSIGNVAVAVVCQVDRWSRVNQVVDAKPMVTRNGEELPVIPNVPVLFPVAYQDIQSGTYGLLIVCRENWRRWWRTGELSAPEDEATHELTNGVFLPDLRVQGGERDMAADTSVLLRPTAGGHVQLGTWNATKHALHEDLTTDLDTFLTLLDTWGAAVGVATGVPWTGQPIQTAIQALIGGAYQSPSVRVED
jgi:hypothetical protein